jgi:RNA-directed DNA polymerase
LIKAKPFEISKRIVWEAYKRVKSNKGSAGVDDETLADFDKGLSKNLYRIWNRMSSGSYIPPAVRTVYIPKSDGSQRKLGIPTVSDRIAQMVVKLTLEPVLDPIFHADSYGYRPGKSALEAIGVARKRCWRYNWVVDLDIKGFFDNIDHALLMRALRKHIQIKWILLYVERWLTAPIQQEDGTLIKRIKGSPQGGVISPLLSNLFLHYAFDEWMRRKHPDICFERYADDALVHCNSEKQARLLKGCLEERMKECKLELHPDKTKIVYCKDADRREDYPMISFDFLGYTFRPRRSKNRWGKYFINFSPAISVKSSKKIRDTIRSWRLHLRSDKSIEDLSHMFNSVIRGWINYYGRYYKSELYSSFRNLNRILMKWVMRKYKKFRGHRRRAMYWLGRLARRNWGLFAHWQLGLLPSAGQ